MKRVVLLSSALVLGGLATHTNAQAEVGRSLLVFYSQAECIQRNADRYLEFVDGPTLIFPGFCEEDLFDPSPSEVAASTSENAFGQSTFVIAQDDSGARKELPRNQKAVAVVLTDEHIRCLSQRFSDVVKRQTRVLESGGSVDIAEILIDLC